MITHDPIIIFPVRDRHNWEFGALAKYTGSGWIGCVFLFFGCLEQDRQVTWRTFWSYEDALQDASRYAQELAEAGYTYFP